MQRTGTAAPQHEPGKGRPASRSLKGRALQYLSQREHSRAELRRKLLPHAVAELAAKAAAGEAPTDRPAVLPSDGMEQEAASAGARVEAVLDWLEAQRYLSDQRFVESRVHVRASRFGNLRIRQELSRHQVALSPEAAQALRDSEFDRASAVRVRKFAANPVTPAEKAKQARFLAGRGFTPDVISRVLRDCSR